MRNRHVFKLASKFSKSVSIKAWNHQFLHKVVVNYSIFELRLYFINGLRKWSITNLSKVFIYIRINVFSPLRLVVTSTVNYYLN